jgi:hypothetical protein
VYQIESFDSFEELQNKIDAGVRSANERVKPVQAAIGYGDHWFRVWGDVLICGRVSPKEETDADSDRLCEDPEEAAEEKRMLEASYARGFRFGRAYSVIEPRGELGDTHVADMVPMTAEQFEECRLLGWELDRVMFLPWYGPALIAVWPAAEKVLREKGWQSPQEIVAWLTANEFRLSAGGREMLERHRRYVNEGR